jgi:hypothetical protein
MLVQCGDRVHAGGWDVVVRGPSPDGMQPATVAKVVQRRIAKPAAGPNRQFAIFRSVRPLRRSCHFTSARKLGVGSALMIACLDAFAVTLGVPPAAAPWIAGNWRVTCAAY